VDVGSSFNDEQDGRMNIREIEVPTQSPIPQVSNSGFIASCAISEITYTPHLPISIRSDADFGPGGYNFTGSGTSIDPLLIELRDGR
jgi:hypothetical protein